MLCAGAVHAAQGVRIDRYTGWDGSIFLHGKDPKVMAIIVPAVGGRIVHFGLDENNVLYEHLGTLGKTLANTKEWFWMGGYQCDIGPEIRGIPAHPILWLGPCRSKTPRARTAVVLSEPDPTVGVAIEKEIELNADIGELSLKQTLRNTTNTPVSYCLWDRTQCNSGGFVLLPLDPQSRFPAGWSIRQRTDGRFHYETNAPAAPQARVMDGVLVLRAEEPAVRVGTDSRAGWIAYAWERLLFIKYFRCFPDGPYTDGGNTTEAYVDDTVAEIDPLSPEKELQPGEVYSFPERWVLKRLPEPVESFEAARALVGQIGKSPLEQ